MAIELSVADVREALARAAGQSAIGAGEAATMLLGRVFHEVFASLVSADPNQSGLRVILEGPADSEARLEALTEHTWKRLVAPRLRQHAAQLQTSSEPVLVLWRATRNLLSWLERIVNELDNQAVVKAAWSQISGLLRSEVPLACELREPGWTESVRLVGIADSILHAPHPSNGGANYCAIELKLGRAKPVVDLGQAALYHLILARSRPVGARSALALMRFSPNLEEHIIESQAVAVAEQRLIELIGKLACVLPATPPPSSSQKVRSKKHTSPANGSGVEQANATRAANTPALPAPDRPALATPPIQPKDAERFAEVARRLVAAYRVQGVNIELREPPRVGPRFMRCDVRLSRGGKVDALRRCTQEIQHQLELRTEPFVVQDAGRLYIDIARPDPQSVEFSTILSQLPAPNELEGSAKIPIGVDATGHLHLTDLGSSGRSHVLAAGTTGSGKTEWLRMMMAGLIATNTPDTLRFVTLDPKLLAFADLERSKFLWKPGAWWIQGSEQPASELFRDLVEEMERRYRLTRESGADNLREHVQRTGKPLARIVCVCDEYFALVAQNREEKQHIEESVSLLGAKARAAGIHLVLATQQPSRAIINGAIQANLPCRVALLLQSHIESSMILGSAGAERLTGSGDLLYKDFGNPTRLQAPLLTDKERASWLRK
jgi:S-DNA-T family DNA segregation ATPase FtsK/SpoIIIE